MYLVLGTRLDLKVTTSDVVYRRVATGSSNRVEPAWHEIRSLQVAKIYQWRSLLAFASFHLVVGRDDYVLVKANCVSTVKMQKCLENARRLGD
jgi:hypothetical protein